VSHHTTGALFALAGAVALLALAQGLRGARRRGDLDAAFALTFGVGVLFFTPAGLVGLTGLLVRRPDSFGNLMAVNPSWYRSLDAACVALTGALAVFLLLRALARDRPVRLAAAPALAIAVWAFARLAAGLDGEAVLTARAASLFLVLLAATVVRGGRGAAVGAASAAALLAGASGIEAAFRYDVAFVVPCQGACSGLGFSGVLPNENLLGVALAAGIPFAYIGFRGAPRVLLPVLLGGGAIATGSRTAVATAVVVVVALAFIRPSRDLPVPGRRSAAAWAMFLVSAAAAFYVAQHDWAPGALTGRGELWRVAWHYIARSLWFGYGPDKWTSLAGQSQILAAAQHTTHNLWTDLLFTGGVVGTALFVAMVAAALAAAGAARDEVLLVLATIFTLGTAEGTWTVGALDVPTYSMIGFLLLAAQPRAARMAAPAAWRQPSSSSAVFQRSAQTS
jgi:hypothetical protein